jgi:hypothetical protein
LPSLSDNSIIQNHNGPGDNVGGNKIINQCVSIGAIKEPIIAILNACRYRQISQAKDKLELLSKASNLDTDAVNTIKLIRTLVDIFQGKSEQEYIHQINSYVTTITDEFFRDIAISALLRVLIKKGSSDALLRYKHEKQTGIYTDEVFFEYLAEIEEIKDTFNTQKFTLTEYELCGLIRGAIRQSCPNEALEVAEYLRDNYLNLNSKILVVLAKAQLFDEKINARHYWSLNACLQKELINICNDLATLLKECNAEDARIVQQSAVLVQYTMASYSPLADVCWAYISEVEQQVPDVAYQLRTLYELNPQNKENKFNRFFKVSEDVSYREQVLCDIFSSNKISIEDVAIIKNYGDKSQIDEWLTKEGEIVDVDQLQHDFSIIELKLHTCNDDLKRIDNIRILVKDFIKTHSSKLQELNPPVIVELADRLIESGLSDLACDLLKPQISDKNIWASPIVKCYLNALLVSQQLATLNSVLVEIDNGDSNVFILQIKARHFDSLHRFEEAINTVNLALTLAPNSLHNWDLLIYLHKKNNTDDELLAEVLSKIPEEIFDSPSGTGYKILIEVANLLDFLKVESILLRWFINDPDGNAVSISNFSLSEILTRKTHKNYSPTVGRCLGAVCYTSDGEQHTKLLVTDDIAHHHCLIKTSSPLGKVLLKMNVGDTELEAMRDIKLIERIPPFVAAFRISSDLRQLFNDGSDCFYSLKMPSDPDEMVKSLERKISSLNNGSKSFYSQPNIPLFVKGFHQNNHDIVKSALHHLTSIDSVKHPLPAFGIVNPEQVILDVYSAVYLALTNLAQIVISSNINIVITRETKYYLEQWLDDVNRADYLTIDVHPDGGLLRSTYKDITRQTATIQEALRLILVNSQVILPNLVDIPPEMLRIESIVDSSVLSSFKLSISNEIPWFCIDLVFAQLANASGNEVVNVSQLIISLTKGFPIEEKLQAISLHTYSGLPFPITKDDLYNLSNASEEHELHMLAEILVKCSTPSGSIEDFAEFLSIILGRVLANAYLNGEILNGLRVNNISNNGLAERIFNICCYNIIQFKNSQEAEYKISIFLAKLLYKFREIPPLNRLLRLLATQFISGHFMSFESVNDSLKDLIEEYYTN